MKGYRGTRDFLPSDWRIQQYLFKVWRNTSLKYGFSEYEAPIIEPVELYIKKSGEDIKEQLFWFQDKGGREVCLRPELTQQLARYVSMYGKSFKKPLKWFSIPRLFRYERPQKGRYREFFQFNADVIGSNIKDTIEVINLCIDLMKSFKLTSKDFQLKINDRVIVDGLIKKFKIKKTKEFYTLLDKRYKLTKSVFNKKLKNISPDLELKNVLLLNGGECLKKIKKLGLDTSRTDEIFKSCDKSFITFDLSIVRGLDYYTGIVWEAYDTKGEYRSLMGGGEYENLIPGTSCVGVGISDGVLPLLLAEKGLLPESKINGFFIITIGGVYKQASKIASKLRKKTNVYLNTSDSNISKQLDLANDLGYKQVIIIGERDLKNEEFTVKNLQTGKERKVKLNKLNTLSFK